MRKLTMEELNRIEFFGGAKIGEDEYTFPKWIPVAEMLPGVPKWPEWPVYLTCDKYGIIEVQHWYCGWNCSGTYNSDEVDRTYENKNIVAWMPLPYKYQEEKEDEEV